MIEITNEQDIFNKLDLLEIGTKPRWGIMTPQHMVEHITMSVKISNGSLPIREPKIWNTYTENEKEEKTAKLYGTQHFEPNIQNPAFSPNTLQPLRKENLTAAKEWFIKELKLFLDFWQNNPHAELNHMVFGPLNYNSWLIFHKKHLTHHFTQFGLL